MRLKFSRLFIGSCMHGPALSLSVKGITLVCKCMLICEHGLHLYMCGDCSRGFASEVSVNPGSVWVSDSIG